jgi:hypothetical protein
MAKIANLLLVAATVALASFVSGCVPSCCKKDDSCKCPQTEVQKDVVAVEEETENVAQAEEVKTEATPATESVAVADASDVQAEEVKTETEKVA